MTSLELLKEIEAWLCFNTEPSKEETAKLRKSINDHVSEQLNLPPVSNNGVAVCSRCGAKTISHPTTLCYKCWTEVG